MITYFWTCDNSQAYFYYRESERMIEAALSHVHLSYHCSSHALVFSGLLLALFLYNVLLQCHEPPTIGSI